MTGWNLANRSNDSQARSMTSPPAFCSNMAPTTGNQPVTITLRVYGLLLAKYPHNGISDRRNKSNRSCVHSDPSVALMVRLKFPITVTLCPWTPLLVSTDMIPNNQWHMYASNTSVVTSPREAAIGVAMLSGLMLYFRQIKMVEHMIDPRIKLATLAVMTEEDTIKTISL